MVPRSAKTPDVKGMRCLKCNHELSAPRRLASGQWAVDCDACKATVLLRQHPDMPHKFSIGGVIVNRKSG